MSTSRGGEPLASGSVAHDHQAQADYRAEGLGLVPGPGASCPTLRCTSIFRNGDSLRGGLLGASSSLGPPRVAEARAVTAPYCTIFPVARGGWCFYDCVAKQARRDSDPTAFDLLALAALAIEQLIIRKEEFEEGMPENSEHWNRLFEH